MGWGYERIAMTYECRHIKHNGTKCQSPALRGTPYCYFHTRLHRFTAKPSIGQFGDLRLPVLEDRSAIQIALAQVLDALSSSRIDARHARLYLYALQIASQNVERDRTIVPTRTVESLTQTDTREELGPAERICNRDQDQRDEDQEVIA
jgi:hypothetical protein